jgi:hypothetical protein
MTRFGRGRNLPETSRDYCEFAARFVLIRGESST